MEGNEEDIELKNEFLEESKDIIQNINSLLSDFLESSSKQDQINEIFRGIHTIKGASSMFALDNTHKVAHELETYLGKAKEDASKITEKELFFIQEQVDIIEDLLINDDQSELLQMGAQVSIEGEDNSHHENKFTSNYFKKFISDFEAVIEDLTSKKIPLFEIRLPLEKSEKYIEILKKAQIEKLHEEELEDGSMGIIFMIESKTSSSVDHILEKLKNNETFNWIFLPGDEKNSESPGKNEKTENVAKENNSKGNSSTKNNNANEVLRVPLGQVNDTLENIWEIFLIRNQMLFLFEQNKNWIKKDLNFLQTFESLDASMKRNIHEIESKVMEMRMGSLKNVFTRMDKIVRTYTTQSSKKINFVTNGEETKLDKKVIDKLAEPLVHLIRNAMDHGLESNKDRVEVGKDEIGTIELSAKVNGNNVLITIKDDGKGIDHEMVLESAKRKGLDVSDVETPQEAIDLIFKPGFSTAKKVTDVSGRGVGMDAVKTAIGQLGGNINVKTEIGKGSSFNIELPLGLSVISALIIDVNGLSYALDSKFVIYTKTISKFALKKNGQDFLYKYNDEFIQCYKLQDSFIKKHNKTTEGITTTASVCVIDLYDKRVALLADTINQSTSLVVKPNPEFSPADIFISGVSIMECGKPVFILDPRDMLNFIEELKPKHQKGYTYGKCA
ncbi:MAG: chemotaxis protein CheA [Bacteriovoracaceae bacterium]